MGNVLFISSSLESLEETYSAMAQWTIKRHQQCTHIHILVDDEKHTAVFFAAMAEASLGRFVPFDTQWHPYLPIYIGAPVQAAYTPDVVLNLTDHCLQDQQSGQVIEWIRNTSEDKALKRQRYRKYQTMRWHLAHQHDSN